MGAHSKIIRKSQFMPLIKVYFVLKMYFHILRIFVLYDIERYTYDRNHILHTNSSLLSVKCVALSLLFNKCCCYFCKTCRTCRDMTNLLMVYYFNTMIFNSISNERMSPNS